MTAVTADVRGRGATDHPGMRVNDRSDGADPVARVVIAGGGFAAVEALLAVREAVGPRADVTLVSPRPTLDFRPAATIESFADVQPLRYDLRSIVEGAGGRFRQDAIAAVAGEARRARLRSFTHLSYDALVLAVGTQPQASVAGASTFRDQRDVPQLLRIIGELEDGAIRRLVFAAPAGVSWPLPLYELALLAARRAEARGVDVDIALVTPERAPLEALGGDASVLVRDLLADRGVRFIGRTFPAAACRDGRLELHFSGWMRADRVIAVPELLGRRIVGVPSGWTGFLPVDQLGRVRGMTGVYAAGDITTFPLKHGGLATQQADVIGHAIAASLGLDADAPSTDRVLHLRLAAGADPLVLRIVLDADGRPGETELCRGPATPDPRTAKVHGRYLTPYLAASPALAA
jgi:sulfide:quinone oxidoreductase